MAKISFNPRWTAEFIRDIVIPELESFRDVVGKKVLPVFDNFMQEARDHGDTWFREQIAGIEPDHPDREAGIAYFADEAMNRTVDYADTLVGMYFASTGLYILGLFHLFEQHLADLPLRVYDNYNYESAIDLAEVVAWLKDEISVNVKTFRSWKTIAELKLVANTVKHAEGGAARKLRRVRPDLFILPKFRSESKHKKKARMPGRIRRPLLGEDIYITPDEFELYAQATIDFWNELSNAVEHDSTVRQRHVATSEQRQTKSQAVIGGRTKKR